MCERPTPIIEGPGDAHEDPGSDRRRPLRPTQPTHSGPAAGLWPPGSDPAVADVPSTLQAGLLVRRDLAMISATLRPSHRLKGGDVAPHHCLGLDRQREPDHAGQAPAELSQVGSGGTHEHRNSPAARPPRPCHRHTPLLHPARPTLTSLDTAGEPAHTCPADMI